MRTTVVWLLACVISVTDAAPLKVMSAPNLLHVGIPENIFVECQDCAGEGPMTVTISVQSYPTKHTQFAFATVQLDGSNKFQAFGEIVIPPVHFVNDPTVKQYVYLQADFPRTRLEKVILVSFQSAYLFIQTDKTLYTPDSTVKFRVFGVTPGMKPIGIDNSDRSSFELGLVNPEGMVTPLGLVALRSGIYSGEYRLDRSASIGQWEIVSHVQSMPQQSYSAKFEVKTYVLPSYNVKLTPDTSFYYFDSESFRVTVTATYLFGKKVNGMALVVFGVIKDHNRRVFPASMQRFLVNEGTGEATLQKHHILKTFPSIEDLVGGQLFVSATVYTESGSEMVEGELRNIQIVSSPYSVNLDKTPKYYKAGVSFDVTVTVTYPDGSPAENVPIQVAPAQLSATTGSNGRATVSLNTRASDSSLTITARTNDNTLPLHRQASGSMVAKSQLSNSPNFIKISLQGSVRVGSVVRAVISISGRDHLDITYLILSRGQLIDFGRISTTGQVVIAMSIPVTQKMLPSFRLIVYYHPTPTEVVSDSVLVDVEHSCVGSLNLEARDPRATYSPKKKFTMRINGEPGATVALGAVDKGAYVLNKKHVLTQKKVWETVEKADTGCTPGGGENNMAVIFDAGLMFQTDTAGGTPVRQELTCAAPAARKRRSDEEDPYLSSDEVSTRSFFPESQWWTVHTIPQCGKENCFLDVSYPLKDSVTTVVVSGISLSTNNGICVAKPLDVVIFQSFFIDLRLPHSAVVGEQIEIRAVLHNYNHDPITVRIELEENKDVCSSASKLGKYIRHVKVLGFSTHTVPYVIVPNTVGMVDIQVKAMVKDSLQADGVRKRLLVVPYGHLTKEMKVIELNPKGVSQEQTINHIISETQMVPNTPSSSSVFLTGRKHQSISIEDMIRGSSVGSLIYPPTGNGEQNLNHMTATVIATMYLDTTHQWTDVGLEKRAEALAHIRTGFLNVMNFAKPDGSFAFFSNRETSTWLTAHVVKVLSMAGKLIDVDSNAICNTVRFLLLTRQQLDGRFNETAEIIQEEHTVNDLGADADASLTAFCLIALQESQNLCHLRVNHLSGFLAQSVAYLEKRLPTLNNSYAVTITSYALANANKFNKEILYRFASPEKNHWTSPLAQSYSLQANAYALLALVKSEFLEDAATIVRWFSSQQNVGGAYGSTQATMMVYQALSDYWTNAKDEDCNLDVELTIPNRATPYIFRFNKENRHSTRQSPRFGINENVTFKAKGTGQATLTLVSEYYSPGKKPESDCAKFNLSVEFSLEFAAEMDMYNEDIYKLRMEFNFKDDEMDASMSILDVKLPSGFVPVLESLDALAAGGGHVTAFWKKEALSSEGSVIFYLDKVAHDRTEELAFRARQVYKVAVQQPASVSIQQYFEETKCVKYFLPERRDARILRRCSGDVCQCVEENCSKQQKGLVDARQRQETACQSNIDFVYHVIVENFQDEIPFDAYTLRIKKVIKQGRHDFPEREPLRKFFGLSHCRESLNLQLQRGYLIMGSTEHILPDASTQFGYLLSESTWIEFWPSNEECQMEEHRRTCLGIENLVNMLETSGCRM